MRLTIFSLLILCFCGLPIIDSHARNRGMLTGVHGDRELMPKSCRACHRGMNMTIRGEEQVCLNCHGSPVYRDQMEAKGYLLSS